MGFNNNQFIDFYTPTWKNVPGVYGIYNRLQQIIYVGQTDDFKRRMAEHQNDKTHCMHRYAPTLVLAEVIGDQATRNVRERQLILELRPPCNQR